MVSILTLPGLLDDVCQHRPRADHLVFFQEGRWQQLSSAEMRRIVHEIGMGLVAQGVAPGDRVGILAPSSVWWLLFDLGALSIGAVTVPLFANLSSENLAFELHDAAVRLVFVSDAVQEHILRQAVATGLDVVVLDPHGTSSKCVSLQELRRQGAARPEAEHQNLSKEVTGDKPATIIYTSGSTGRPKGVCLTHSAFGFQIQGTRARFPLDPKTDVCFTCLPLAHVFERMVVYFHLGSGCPLWFAEDIQKVGESLRVARPTAMTVVPRLLEKMLDKIEAGARQGPPAKRLIAGLAMRLAQGAPGGVEAVARKALDKIAYSKVREALGGRLRYVVSGGAALPLRVERMLTAFGVPVYQGYGMTEHSPVITANFPGANRPGSVGMPFPGVQLKIAADGEVMAKSPALMSGYWHKPKETRETIDAEGWLHTGDLGRVDPEGYLFLTGRKKDLCKTAGGKYVAPAPIEEALASHRLIEHAVVAADGKKFVSAVLSPDLAGVKAWIQDHGIAQNEAEFLASPEFREQISRHIAGVNAGLNEWEKVRKWILAPQIFSIEGGELTPTLKVRRGPALEKHNAALLALYQEVERGA